MHSTTKTDKQDKKSVDEMQEPTFAVQLHSPKYLLQRRKRVQRIFELFMVELYVRRLACLGRFSTLQVLWRREG